MQIIKGLHKFNKKNHPQPVIIAIGTFDGVHQAHQKIIRTAVSQARKRRGTSVIVTFYPHPRKVASPQQAPALLTSIEHRTRLIGELEPDICLIVNFQKRFAHLSPEEFLQRIVKRKLGAAGIVVGDKFNFGKGRQGTIQDLKQGGASLDYNVTVIPAYKKKGQIISSSRIRSFIEKGELRSAAAMLGRRVSILGTVKHGRARGRTLGFPTANLDPHHECIPADGVYAVLARTSNKEIPGVCSIGTQPTFSPRQKKRIVEVHICNGKRNLYGKELEVTFVRRLRQQKQYDSVQKLIQQMHRDKTAALKILT